MIWFMASGGEKKTRVTPEPDQFAESTSPPQDESVSISLLNMAAPQGVNRTGQILENVTEEEEEEEDERSGLKLGLGDFVFVRFI